LHAEPNKRTPQANEEDVVATAEKPDAVQTRKQRVVAKV
jgi:hypothetical protein